MRARGGKLVHARALDALGRSIDSTWGFVEPSLGIVEMAVASGVARIGSHELDALNATSRGTGDLMADALARVDELIVTVGGSASTDGGTGAASALGWRFLDRDGRDLEPGGAALNRLDAIERPDASPGRVIGACDVQSPLLGPSGSAHGFSAQKGASPKDVALLESGLERLALVVERDLGIDIGSIPRGGAGGGMGAGLLAFAGAELVSGFDLVADWVGLDDYLPISDLVITGEGTLDEKSLEGKVPGSIAGRASHLGKRCVAIAGEIQPGLDRSLFAEVLSLSELFGREPATSSTAEVLAEAGELAARS
jgi:glycerate kinase